MVDLAGMAKVVEEQDGPGESYLFIILHNVYLKKELIPLEVSAKPQQVERFEVSGDRLVRCVLRRDGTLTRSDMGDAPKSLRNRAKLQALADAQYLRELKLPQAETKGDPVTIVDLFCGIGALTLGAFEAARAIGRPASVILAADADPAPVAVFRETFGLNDQIVKQVDLGEALRRSRGARTKAELAFLGKKSRRLDILLAGPPCQGHSRLNNHTRHDDPRNDLYQQVGRFVELERPRLCVIENVDSIVNDIRLSASDTARRLESLGYQVDEGRISLHDLGVPQRRRRHVLVATQEGERKLAISQILADYAVEDPGARNLRWAINDLKGKTDLRGFDAAGTPSDENRKRIRWLHEHAERFDLPNSRRPACHKKPRVDQKGIEKEHSYKSMYGKLDWRKPAQTITSGFGSMGQGRYVHPERERTLTPHEAARLQFIPDFVRFDAVSGRGRWARLIGNVAPMKLSYVFALEFLR
jgi:DNA (cytosine-5)-methyltransferase 1